jgi:hypothetical protein
LVGKANKQGQTSKERLKCEAVLVELITSCILAISSQLVGFDHGPLAQKKIRVQAKGLPNSELISSSWK